MSSESPHDQEVLNQNLVNILDLMKCINKAVGLPDPKMVEEIAAWIKLKTGATLETVDIDTFCPPRIADPTG